ncbi:imidazoleglycerol-phosphate dehydratase HisB [Aciditerrimonas ferrireducens]|uniref:Imidazoleglycerol-phosphate dehydratase n=1 Tax=Aciditerrimonas ferrireducens TaxID=667306 RepID=A0ABV6C376_9ACTN
MSGGRRGSCERATTETHVAVTVDLDGSGEKGRIATGLPFFDHMLAQLARHGRLDLEVQAEGDLAVDAHHTVEDVGICLGQALGRALGERRGVRRFASLAVPLDEALVTVALDLSGRPYLAWGLTPEPTPLGDPAFHPQLAEEFWRAVVGGAGLTLHVRQLAGVNPHHVLEAAFKALGRALHEASRVEGGGVPSTKGVL